MRRQDSTSGPARTRTDDPSSSPHNTRARSEGAEHGISKSQSIRGRILKTFEELTDKQLETAVHAAEQCFNTWRYTTFAERTAVLKRAAAILRSQVEDFAWPITLEMGKLIEESRCEVALSAHILDSYAQNA